MATAESRAAAAYAALRATAAAAEATLASARAEAAAAEAAAAAARATVDAKVADAQAAVAAMRTHPCHAFSGSPPFSLLDARGSLRLVTDAVHEDDALCLALTCRALRDALWARFPRRPAGDASQCACARPGGRTGAHAGRGGGGDGGSAGVGAGPGPAVARAARRLAACEDLRDSRAARRAGLAAVGAGERLRLERVHVQCGGGGRAPRRATVGEGERLRMELGHVHSGGGGRAPRRATVGEGERLRMELGHVQPCGGGRAPRCATVGAGERLRVGRGHVLGGRMELGHVRLERVHVQ